MNFESIVDYLKSKEENEIDIRFEEIERISGPISLAYLKYKNIQNNKFAFGKAINKGGYQGVTVDYNNRIIHLTRNQIEHEIHPTIHNTRAHKNRIINEYLVELTDANSQIVENQILHDRKYAPNAARLFERLLGNLPLFNFSVYDANFVVRERFTSEVLFQLVRQIKIDNKIQHSNNENLQLIVEFIFDSRNNFYARNFSGDISLVEDLNNYVKENSEIRGEPSLCSKVIKYLNQFIYGGDAYYIYDSVVKSFLNVYRHKYGLPSINNNYYSNFYTSMEELRNIACPTMTRNHMDHIIWYTNK